MCFKRLGVARIMGQGRSAPTGNVAQIFLSMVFSTLLATQAHSQDETLRIATRPNLPPYVHEGAHAGIEIDVVKAIFKETGQPIEFVQMDRVAMIQQFEQGSMNGTLTQNATTAGKGCMTNWYIVHQNVGFTMRSKKIKLEALTDLADLPVVSFHNATTFLGEAFRNIVTKNPRYQEIAPQSSQIALLYNGDFDVIVGDEWIIRYAQRQHFERTGEYQELTVHGIMKPTLYAARFQKKETCDSFNNALRTLRLNGSYDQIVDGYHRRIMVAAQSSTPD